MNKPRRRAPPAQCGAQQDVSKKNIAEPGMLTRTYTSLALSYEQKNAWKVLSKLKACLREARCGAPATDSKAALKEFTAAGSYYRERTLEQHVIPAIRKYVPQAKALLAELESLAAGADGILHGLQARQSGAEQLGPGALSEMEQYCQHQLERLRKEESELIPLAFRALTPEEWFAIAVKCLPDDHVHARKAA